MKGNLTTLLSTKTKGVLGAHYHIPGTFLTSEIQEKVFWLLQGGVFKFGGIDIVVLEYSVHIFILIIYVIFFFYRHKHIASRIPTIIQLWSMW